MAVGESVRTIRRFGWGEVPADLVRAMLIAYWPEDRAELLRCSDAAAISWATDAFGADPRRRSEPLPKDVVRVLCAKWVPTADEVTIERLVTMLERTLGPAPTSRGSRAKWIRDRNLTDNLRANVTRSFCNAHRAAIPVATRSVERARGARVRDLVGADRPGNDLRDHQRSAQTALDAVISSQGRSALLVMPTGSGKTHTMVSWLLEQMDAEPDLRVLWLAHRRELVDQAASEFESAAASRPATFRRVLRAVHGGAAELVTLADRSEPVDVAVATVQSLTAGSKATQVMTSFFKRPVVVVLDEAHHAGADQTDKFLRALAKRANHRLLVGLTATPFPTSIISQDRFSVHFPDVTYRVDAPSLISQRVLARPITVVVDTGQAYRLPDDVVGKLEHGAEPANAYDVLDDPTRNRLIADLCREHRDTHGPTLLFALNIDHAEALVEELRSAGVGASAVHSRSEQSIAEAKEWFNTETNPVLVSVAMLNEGVDLPRARTAFLARPTISRILMQQMVGRVLRGPLSGGDTDAYVVYLNDQFDNYSDLLDPAEVLDQYEPRRRHGVVDESSDDLPDVVDDTGSKVRFAVVGQLGRMLAQPIFRGELDDDDTSNDRPFDATLSPRTLCGYYELPTVSVPVLDHQQERWEALIDAVLAGESHRWQQFFAMEPPPAPSGRAVTDMVQYVRVNRRPPRFVELSASLGPSRCADALQASPALTEAQRAELMVHEWRTSVNAEVYPTADHFAEAVDRELRDRLRAGRLRHTPPSPSGRRARKQPTMLEHRPLSPLMTQTVDEAREIVTDRLVPLLDDLPQVVDWSPRPIHHLYAYWNISTHGKNRGKRWIIVSSLYRTTHDVVTDEMLRYLLWHELLHDLLPGQQHDAEFRTLEHRWPGAVELDAEWYTLRDRYRFPEAAHRQPT